MKYVRLEQNEAIATLTLNRPQKLNSLSVELMDELAQALEEIAPSTARVVILGGAGRAFCAGIDLGLLAGAGAGEAGPAQIREIGARWQATLTALEGLPQVTIAIVNGVAYGAAIELMLCCDFRFASSRASFGMQEVKFGIVPDLGGIPRLVRSVGVARTKEIILRARNFGAMEALRLGLVNRVTEPGDLAGQARQWAEIFARTPMAALTHAKRLINAAPEQLLADSLRLALEAQVELMQLPEFKAALAAATEEPQPQKENQEVES